MEKMIADYLNCSTEEVLSNKRLCSKINAIRSLYSENKINTLNAFDLDMADSLYEWLKNKKQEGSPSIQSLFDDLSDYLDTTAKIYCHRIDNVNKTIYDMYSKIKTNVLITTTYKPAPDKLPQVKKKRTRAMLTTDDKLRGKPLDFIPRLANNQIDMEELNKVASSKKYLEAVLNNTTFEEELKQSKENYKRHPEMESMGCSSNMINTSALKRIRATEEICPDFDGFVAERDLEPNTTENIVFECIEDRFDPVNDPVVKEIIEMSKSEKMKELDSQFEPDSKPSDSKIEEFEGLVACIDFGKSDYTFFDPAKLAIWSGPKAWKEMTLARSLKTLNQKRQHTKTSSENDCETYKSKDLIPKQKPTKNQSKDNTPKIKWMGLDEISSKIKVNRRKNQIKPNILQKWHYSNNIGDPISLNMNYKYTFMKTFEETRTSLIKSLKDSLKQKDKESFSNDSLLDKQHNDYDKIENMFNGDYVDNNVSLESTDNEDSSKDEQIMETVKDVGVLKSEILNIINQECAVFQQNSEWSNSLHFRDLLRKLKYLNQPELPMRLIYVSLLHLCNEEGIKLTNSSNDSTDITHLYISKPNKRMI